MGLTKPRAAQIYDLDYKQAVRVITVTDVASLDNGAPNQVDGVNLSAGDRVLVAGQNTASQNGLYYVENVGSGSDGTWERTADGNQTGEIEAGMIVMVTEGLIYADTQWKLTTDDPIVIGVSALTFVINILSTVGGANTQVQFNDGGTLGATAQFTFDKISNALTVGGNITGGNLITSGSGGNIVLTGGNITGASVISATGNITGGNLLGNSIVGTLTTTAQTNITSVGTLDSLTVTANIDGGNVLTGGVISATGNITGNYILGNGSQLTGIVTDFTSLTSNIIPASNVTYSLGNATNQWANIYVGGNTIFLGGLQLKDDGSNTLGVYASDGTTPAELVATSELAQYVTQGAQANITSVGTLTVLDVTGNVSAGNVSGTLVTGTLTTASQPNITSVGTLTSLSATGNVKGGNINTDGNVTSAWMLPSVGLRTDGNILVGGYLSVVGNLYVANIISSQTLTVDDPLVYLNASSPYPYNYDIGFYSAFVGGAGNTYQHTGLVRDYVDNTWKLVSNVPEPAGSAFDFDNAIFDPLKVGSFTATTVSASGNTTSGNFIGTLNGSGANVTSISATNISSGTLAQARLANAAVTLGSTALTLGSTVTTVAGLSSVTSTTFVGALTGAATTAGTVTTAAQPNITSVGTLSSLAVTGNITGGNFVGTLNGSGANVTSISATNISSGTLAQARLANAAVTLGSTALTLGSTVTTVAGLSSVTSTTFVGALTGAATTAGTVTTAAQPNITSVGTLSSLAVTGNISFGGSLVDTAALEIVTGSNGNITLSPNGSGLIVANKDIRNGQTNGVGNIGAVGATFNTIFAKATSAQYADLAEMYVSDADYPPGTVVEFGGEHEITISSSSHSTTVAGIVSTNPSYLMNSSQSGEHVLPIALTGRVPCCVQGPVRKGDVLVSSNIPGVAQRIGMNWQPGCVLGKAMEKIESVEIQTIEVAVGRF